MKVLGLDISTKSTGWALKDYKTKKLTFGHFAKPYKTKGLSAILYQANKIKELLEKEKPNTIIMEDTYLGRNFGTVKLMNMLRGWVYIYCVTHDFIVYPSISASHARKVVGIKVPRGLTKKARKQVIINFLRHKGYNVTQDDEADAICLILATEKEAVLWKKKLKK